MISEVITIENEKVDKLEAMLFQLIQLHDRYAQEHQLLSNEREEFIKLSELLANQVKEIGKPELAFHKTIQDSMLTLIDKSTDKMAESFIQKGQNSTEKFVNKIEQYCNRLEPILDKSHHEKNRFSWRGTLLTVVSSVITTFLIMWLILPKQTLPLTGEQLNYLRDGQMLAKIWPNLSDAEKSHLKNIADKIVYSN